MSVPKGGKDLLTHSLCRKKQEADITGTCIIESPVVCIYRSMQHCMSTHTVVGSPLFSVGSVIDPTSLLTVYVPIGQGCLLPVPLSSVSVFQDSIVWSLFSYRVRCSQAKAVEVLVCLTLRPWPHSCRYCRYLSLTCGTVCDPTPHPRTQCTSR